jgi:hypothetical protein
MTELLRGAQRRSCHRRPFDREPSIVRRQAQDGDIRSVKSGALAIFPLAWVELGDPM